MTIHRTIITATLLLATSGICCGKAPEPPAAPETAAEPAPVKTEPGLAQARPFLLEPAVDSKSAEPSPLILLLHGYGAPSRDLTQALGLKSRTRSEGFFFAVPDGTEDPRGLRFWNAASACCNFFGSDVDDVAYLGSLIDDVKARRNIDPARVFVVGHSNGGFMALRLACELSDRIAGIASIAGAGSDAPDSCRPGKPVAVLQIHGDQDWHVPYDGGRVLRRTSGGTHPSAAETVARWAERNGCSEKPTPADDVDLEPMIPGAETAVTRHTGCKGGAAELWAVRGGDHFVAQHPKAFDAIFDWLMAHPKQPAER